MQSSVSFDQFRCFCHIGSLSLQVCLTANVYCLGSEMNVVQMPGNIARRERERERQETDFFWESGHFKDTEVVKPWL
jgi:hypothetical protein